VLEILPYVEQQALYARFDRTKAPNHADNAAVVGTPIPFLVCPSSADESTPDISPLSGGLFDTDDKQDGGSNVNPNRATSSGRATQVMGLWYPVSAGPTHFDGCPFCPPVTGNALNFCCQGNAFGSGSITANNDPLGPAGTPTPTFAGMFGRYEKGIKLSEVTDGLSNTVMAGETIAVQCKYQCAHCPNFPISMTNTPINTFVRTSKTLGTGTCVVSIKNSDEGGYCEACGYKSRHPGGAHLLFGDGHVPFVSESVDFNVYYLLGAKSSDQAKQVP
jgi:prepilin-type processing-associated H-X9-DG protein